MTIVIFPFKAIGGYGVKKNKLMLFKSTFYHKFNAFYGNRKFKAVLDFCPGKCVCDPFWAIKMPFWGIFWVIKQENFAFRWQNITKSNIPITLTDQMKQSQFQGQKMEKN